MKRLAQIAALYAQIDQIFQSERDDAMERSDSVAVVRVAEKQLLNDQAYFVLCWGQLETEVDDACRAAINRRTVSADWEMRRGFDIYDTDDKRLSGLPFDRRAAMVLDRRAGRGSPFAKLLNYYAIRNQIAHGKLLASRIDVTSDLADFFIIQAAITR